MSLPQRQSSEYCLAAVVFFKSDVLEDSCEPGNANKLLHISAFSCTYLKKVHFTE